MYLPTRLLFALPLLLVTLALALKEPANSKLVTLNDKGKLAYSPYTAQGDVIPDFSNCGYAGGGVALPNNIPTVETLSPSAGIGDDLPRLQEAIDKVAKLPLQANGYRGALLLTHGHYHLSDTLRISASGVVLRGAGDGEEGTVLHAMKRAQHTLVQVDDIHKPVVQEASRSDITADYVPVGSHTITVQNASVFKPGDTVYVVRLANQKWISTLGMDKIPPLPLKKDGTRDPTNQWTPQEYTLRFDRVVTAVKGNTITLDAPIVNAIQKEFGGGYVVKYTYPDRLEHVGIESIRGESEYTGNTDESHGWNFIGIRGGQNHYVRNVTSRYFGYACVSIDAGAKWVTVQDSTCLDPISQITGGRRYSFNLGGGSLVLFQRCKARGGRHDFVTGSRVPGPNVFLDCQATQAHADSGPHHRWAIGTLYDNITSDNNINVENRLNWGTGHGWSGAQQVFWNCTAPRIICQQPPTAQNFAIGCTATIEKGSLVKDAPKGYIESLNEPVAPRSLYLQQLEDRLGASAVKNVR